MKTYSQLSVVLLILIAFTLPALARLGETPEEIQKRYGAPARDQETEGQRLLPSDTPGLLFDLPTTNYIFKEYIVTVSFKDGKSVCERVKPPKTRAISVEEAKALRDAIGNGLKWYNPMSDGPIWKTGEGDTAEMGSAFTIKTASYHKHLKDYFARQEKLEAEADKKRADGF
jgi:hypothetical protein